MGDPTSQAHGRVVRHSSAEVDLATANNGDGSVHRTRPEDLAAAKARATAGATSSIGRLRPVQDET